MTETQKIIEREKEVVFQTYKRLPILIERGQGAVLFDSEGRKYIDLVSGIAVNALGHCHPEWVKAVTEQASQLVHTSNLVYTRAGVELAEKLVKYSGLDKVFFCNSGTEAVEAAIKVARKWGKAKRGNSCFKLISFERGFHGRTLGALSATANEKYRAPFEPLLPGCSILGIHDHQTLDMALDGTVCAVIVEPIQGEGGVRILDRRCLQGLRKICDQKEVLLICDEIQTGVARTGKWFGYQHSEILPDIITLAKGLGGGFPIGAVVARGKAAETLEPGDHGSTFAGNPLACSAALAVLKVIEEQGLLEAVLKKGGLLDQELKALCEKFPLILDHARGLGLMRALEFKQPIARKVVEEGLQFGIFLNATSDTTLRFVPPLIISEAEICTAIQHLGDCIVRVSEGQKSREA